MSGWRVRDAASGDAARLAAFNLAMARETEGRQLEPSRVERGVARALADPARGRYLIAEDGRSETVGALLITREWSDWRNGCFWWIQSVYVTPAARRQGVFAALWARVHEAATEDAECCGIRLYVERDNARAQRTYAALGMTETDYRLWEIDFSG